MHYLHALYRRKPMCSSAFKYLWERSERTLGSRRKCQVKGGKKSRCKKIKEEKILPAAKVPPPPHS